MITRRGLLQASAAAGLGVVSAPSRGDTWPARFVRVIVPFAPGGATDVMARSIGQRLSEVWGQQVVVETRGGAGGNIGALAVAQSDPDGYTLLLSSVGQAVNRFLYPSLGYDPIADFAPITLMCLQPNIMIVPNSSPAKTPLEFVAFARESARRVTFGSGGTGTSVHLCGELFARTTGIAMTHVPYRGAGPAMADLVGGRLDVMFDNITAGLPQARSGSARGLAVTTARRSSAAPELPPLAEAGVPGFDVSAWFAYYAPAKTAPAIVQKVSTDIAGALAHPPVKARLEQLGCELVGSTPDGLAAHLRAEMDKWGPIIKEAGITVRE